MINKIAFTGREEMLTANLGKGIKKTHEYINAATIYAKKELGNATVQTSKSTPSVYTSPFGLTGNTEITAAVRKSDIDSYAISHGNLDIEV